MSALTIAKTDVLLVAGAVASNQVAGEAFVAGVEVYQANNGQWFKARCDGTALQAGAKGVGMALSTAESVGARVDIARPGAIVSIGAGTEGEIYCLGPTPGVLVPRADLEVGQRVTAAALGIGSNKVLLCYVYYADTTLASADDIAEGLGLTRIVVTMTGVSAQLVPADPDRSILIVSNAEANAAAAFCLTGGACALDAGIPLPSGAGIEVTGVPAQSAMTQIGSADQKLTVYTG